MWVPTESTEYPELGWAMLAKAASIFAKSKAFSYSASLITVSCPSGKSAVCMGPI